MGDYNSKNYTEQGGENTVIGGSLTFGTGATVSGIDATTAKKGIVKQAANVAKAAGTAPTKAEFDALIDALVAAGLMASAT